jgi:hypothetical protein
LRHTSIRAPRTTYCLRHFTRLHFRGLSSQLRDSGEASQLIEPENPSASILDHAGRHQQGWLFEAASRLLRLWSPVQRQISLAEVDGRALEVIPCRSRSDQQLNFIRKGGFIPSHGNLRLEHSACTVFQRLYFLLRTTLQTNAMQENN